MSEMPLGVIEKLKKIIADRGLAKGGLVKTGCVIGDQVNERLSNRMENNKSKVLSVYIAHPYQGKAENMQKAALICREVATIPYLLPISPIHALSFYDERINPNAREPALRLCRELVKKCDLLMLCDGWEKSEGCKMELEIAKENNIPVIEWEDFLIAKIKGCF